MNMDGQDVQDDFTSLADSLVSCKSMFISSVVSSIQALKVTWTTGTERAFSSPFQSQPE